MGQGNPLIKLKAKKGEQQNNQNDSSGKGGYNLKGECNEAFEKYYTIKFW